MAQAKGTKYLNLNDKQHQALVELEGKEITYSELCKALGFTSQSNTKMKLKQLETINRYCTLLDNGKKLRELRYIVTDVKDDVKKVKRKKNPDFLRYINSKNYEDIGVYCLVNDNNEIYVGSTIAGFRQRFLRHNTPKNTLVTKQMLSEGAVFNLLWIAEDIHDEFLIRKIETLYIEYFKNHPDYTLMNTEDEAWCQTEKRERDEEELLDKLNLSGMQAKAIQTLQKKFPDCVTFTKDSVTINIHLTLDENIK